MPTSDFDRDVGSTPARIKEDIRRIMILSGSVIGALVIGYFAPHPPKTVEKLVYQTKEVAHCPDGPFVVQRANGWTFYKDKATGCTYVDAREGMVSMIRPSETCMRLGGGGK